MPTPTAGKSVYRPAFLSGSSDPDIVEPYYLYVFISDAYGCGRSLDSGNSGGVVLRRAAWLLAAGKSVDLVFEDLLCRAAHLAVVEAVEFVYLDVGMTVELHHSPHI